MVAVVHASADVQSGIGVHAGHVSATPFTRKWPEAHVRHCEFDAVVHVSGDVQSAMPVHGTHASAGPDSSR